MGPALWHGAWNLAAAAAGALREWIGGAARRGERSSHNGRPPRSIALWHDVRYAIRGMLKAPGFTGAVILTVAVGVGTTTSIFSVVHGVVLRPLPYHEPDRLVQIFQQNSITNRFGLSVVDYQAIEEQQRTFQTLGAVIPSEGTLTGRGQAVRVGLGRVTAGFFSTLGIRPVEGRGFDPNEDAPGANLVAVISHSFRERHFGSGTNAVGEAITLNGNDYTVVGVLPATARTIVGIRADIWPILQFETPSRRGPFGIRVIARMQPGVTLERAASDLAGISDRLFPVWASTFQDEEARLTPASLRDVIVGDVSGVLTMFLGAVGFVLLIAIANVANLTLARATGREREMALRTSLGATRGRLLRQLLVEHLLLASFGGALGLLLAIVGLDALVSLSPRLPRLDEVGLDGTVLAFSAVVTLGSGVLFGLAPMLRSMSGNLAAPLRAGGRTGTEGRSWNAVRGTLVTAEFALALPLLVGAALLLTSLSRLSRVDAGYNPDNLTSARVALPAGTYPDGAAVRRFWEQALPQINDIPGVRAAGISSALPPDDPGEINNFDLADRPVPAGTSQPVAPWSSVSPQFFDAMGVALLRGRIPDASDAPADPEVVAVSRGWAERFYPDSDVIGKQLYSGGCTAETCSPVTVVGVVGDVKYTGLDTADEGAVYQTFSQYTQRGVNLVVRSEGTMGPVMSGVRAVLHSIDPELPLARVQTMHERHAASVAQPRYWASLAALFASVGVILAAVGVYGVLSYFVSKQTRDIGVRMALGANAASVRKMVVRRGMTQASIGLGVGVMGTLLLTRWLEDLLFEVSPADPITFGGVVILLLVVALLACYWPARRATKVDPIRALAAE
jgi:putative ABC transport system permease protein